MGDIGGIWFNKTTNHVGGGNQRTTALLELYSDLEIQQREDGSLFLETPSGHIFPVRKVKKSLEWEKTANIAANNPHIAGLWTPELGDLLCEIQAELPDLYETLRMDDLLVDVPEVEIEPYQGETDPDDVPLPVAEPVIQRGDLVMLGKHKLLCGDSCKAEDVERLMAGKISGDIFVFADAPYGIKIVAKNGHIGHEKLAKATKYKEVIGDNNTETAKKFYQVCLSIGVKEFILWGGNYFVEFLPFSPSWIIWDKRGDMASNNFADAEMAWTNIKTPVRIYKHIWAGMIQEGEREKRVHPNQKPVEMLKKIIGDFIATEYVVYDGFLGSGASVLACEQLGRICYGMEISEAYMDVCCRRWINFTGKPGDVSVERGGKQYKWEELNA
jgi:DNA modification methylase